MTARVGAGRRLLWVAGWPARSLLIGLIGLYRATLAGVLGGQCRFHPSCSVYAQEAIRNRGALVGTALVAWRVLRCSPLSRGGVDPAPQRHHRSEAGGAAVVYESVIHQPARAAS